MSRDSLPASTISTCKDVGNDEVLLPRSKQLEGVPRENTRTNNGPSQLQESGRCEHLIPRVPRLAWSVDHLPSPMNCYCRGPRVRALSRILVRPAQPHPRHQNQRLPRCSTKRRHRVSAPGAGVKHDVMFSIGCDDVTCHLTHLPTCLHFAPHHETLGDELSMS